MQNRQLITETDYRRLLDILQGAYVPEAPDSPATKLRHELPRRSLIAPREVPRAIVTMNSQVECLDLDTNETVTYTIVYPDDADIDKGKISVLTRLGVALLGAKEGDIVEAGTRALHWQLKILRVLYQPEAAGHFDL
jgi:regulator of nucleoside diphosphate kinase